VGKSYAAGLLIQILAGLTPGFVGAILMAVGAFLLGRRPLGARVAATIGLVLIILTVAVFVALEGPASGHELMIAGAVYVLIHAGVLAWLWRSRARAAI
jgi:membrane-bound ClpP family serine protease